VHWSCIGCVGSYDIVHIRLRLLCGGIFFVGCVVGFDVMLEQCFLNGEKIQRESESLLFCPYEQDKLIYLS